MDATDLAMIAATLSLMAYAPYAWAILRGDVRPQRASWLIWSVLSSVAFFAVLSSDGEKSVLFTGAQTGGTVTIFLLSLWRGAGALWSRRDGTALGLAAFGLGLWAVTDDPAWAMALAIGIGALGGLLTIQKAYRQPRSEALGAWGLQVLAAGLGVASVAGGSLLELAYPLYLLLLYMVIVTAALAGRAVLAPPRGDLL